MTEDVLLSVPLHHSVGRLGKHAGQLMFHRWLWWRACSLTLTEHYNLPASEDNDSKQRGVLSGCVQFCTSKYYRDSKYYGHSKGVPETATHFISEYDHFAPLQIRNLGKTIFIPR